jgi:hypothetical protein
MEWPSIYIRNETKRKTLGYNHHTRSLSRFSGSTTNAQ